MASCVFDREALARAICGRLRQSPGVSLRVHEPVIHHCQCQLGDVKDCGLASWSNQKVAPAGSFSGKGKLPVAHAGEQG